MKSLIWKVLLSFALLLPYRLSQSCGYVPSLVSGYSFINPELIKLAVEPAPFLLDGRFSSLYKFFDRPDEKQAQSNIKEWQSRVCEAASEADIRAVIYESSINDLLSLLRTSIEPDAPLTATFANNDFVDYLLDLKCQETIEYLVFAKRCEPYVTLPADGAWNELNRNPAAMNELIEEGRTAFRRTDSHYIRLRYAYQIVRLAHYLQDYERAIELYNYCLPKTDERNSLINYWLMGHYAGALRGLERNVEASYLYTRIFSECPSRRESAFRSFLIRTNEEWEACYLMCETKEERAAMYAIRAGKSDGRVLDEMKQIYAIDPENNFLELLLLQEIRRLEDKFLGNPAQGRLAKRRVAQLIPKNEEAEYLIDLQDFARMCRQDTSVSHTAFWHTSEGYLEFLAGDYYKARQTLHTVERYVQNEALSNQLNILRTVLYLASIQKIGEEEEEQILDLMEEEEELLTKYPDFRSYFENRIADLYLNSGRNGLAFLAQYDLMDLKFNPDLELVNDLILSLDDGEFDRFVALLNRDTLNRDAILELTNIKATYFMARGQWREASVVWSSINRADWRKFHLSNPFQENFSECLDCNTNRIGNYQDSVGVFTKGRIVEIILEEDRNARIGEEGAAESYYNIGKALYNMSYFGRNWRATDFFRSGASNTPQNLAAKNGVVSHPRTPFGNKENFGLVNDALVYFEEARNLAAIQNKSELAAKAAFMAAKCEQKLYFTSGLYRPSGFNQIPNLPAEYLVNFDYLSGLDYTDFYKRIIQECKYFEAYVR